MARRLNGHSPESVAAALLYAMAVVWYYVGLRALLSAMMLMLGIILAGAGTLLVLPALGALLWLAGLPLRLLTRPAGVCYRLITTQRNR
jgi:hypothetical protein